MLLFWKVILGCLMLLWVPLVVDIIWPWSQNAVNSLTSGNQLQLWILVIDDHCRVSLIESVTGKHLNLFVNKNRKKHFFWCQSSLFFFSFIQIFQSISCVIKTFDIDVAKLVLVHIKGLMIYLEEVFCFCFLTFFCFFKEINISVVAPLLIFTTT